VTQDSKRVFLSYGHDDRPFVRFLANDIRATRVKLWMDELKILPGDSLLGKISAGLTASDYVVACLSQTSVESEWVRTELEIAATRAIREKRAVVVPLLVGSVKSEQVPAFLSHLLYVDFRQARDYDHSLAELLRRIAPEQLILNEGEITPPLHSNILAIDALRAQELVTAATSGLRDWITSYLISALKRPDPTDRHWTYWALGRVGGKDAEQALEKGLETSLRYRRFDSGAVRVSGVGA